MNLPLKKLKQIQLPEKWKTIEWKKYKWKRLEIPWIFSFCLIVLASIGVTHLVFQSAPLKYEEFHRFLLANPSLFWLNYLPILFLMLFLWFLTNNGIFSICASGLLAVILAIANQMKITLRQDPLLPTDLKLAREALTILKSFPEQDKTNIFLTVGGILLVVLLSLLFLKGPKHILQYRIVGCILTVTVALLFNSVYYVSESYYDRFPVDGNYYFQVNHYNSKGFVYSFLHNFNTMKIEKPLGYLSTNYAALEKEAAVPASENKRPHIIMIMGEAFSDLSNNENLDFSGYGDPLENFKNLCSKEDAISGHIVVPNYGGGTSNTEYDVLTSCPTRLLDNALPSYNFVRKNFDALPRRLSQIGYSTLAIHPGYPWFYNRSNVYEYFGFQRFITLADYDPQNDSKGGYISEAATIDTIIETLEEHVKENDNPLFSFTVTIQNHGPYTDKYGDIEKNFYSNIPLNEDEANMLTNYFHGTKDVDQQIGRLVEYMEASTEPIVLVYFGDHLPGFSNGMDFFDILDYDINIDGTIPQRLRVYETPYVIWQNSSAKAITPMANYLEQAALPEQNIISSNYLGSLLMELMGYQGLSPLYDESNALRKELPVITSHSFLQGNGEYIEEIPPELQQKINHLHGWQYFKLFDEIIK